MTHRPLVSVVATAMSHVRYLPRFLRALEAQTVDPADLEVVVADVGGRMPLDVVDAWSRRLAVAGFSALAVPGTASVALARNAGLAQATGRFLVCLDTRDVMDPVLLGRCLSALEEHPRADLACPGWRRPGDDGAHVPDVAPRSLARRDGWSPAALMRRRVWEASRGFAAGTAYPDWDFWVQAEANGFRAVAVHGTLLERRGAAVDMSARSDGNSKAALVLDNRGWFHPSVVSWARALEAHEAWALAGPPGLLPDSGQVRAMRAPAMAGAACAPRLDVTAGSVSVAGA